MYVHLGKKRINSKGTNICVQEKNEKRCHLSSVASMAPAWPSAQIWEEELRQLSKPISVRTSIFYSLWPDDKLPTTLYLATNQGLIKKQTNKQKIVTSYQFVHARWSLKLFLVINLKFLPNKKEILLQNDLILTQVYFLIHLFT